MRCLRLNEPRIAHHGGPVATENRLLGARVLQWIFFEQYSHLPYIGMARYYLHLLKTPPRADDLSTWHLRANIALEITDRHLERNHWFVGDAFTIADIALYAYTHVAPKEDLIFQNTVEFGGG
jgi:glutathione S-transferase